METVAEMYRLSNVSKPVNHHPNLHLKGCIDSTFFQTRIVHCEKNPFRSAIPFIASLFSRALIFTTNFDQAAFDRYLNLKTLKLVKSQI